MLPSVIVIIIKMYFQSINEQIKKKHKNNLFLSVSQIHFNIL